MRLPWLGFEKQPIRGNAAAQNNLGFTYASGQGVRRDLVNADLWFSLAAAGKIDDAAHNRDTLSECAFSPYGCRHTSAVNYFLLKL
jgi:TPR repeat protein